uniref:PHD-type domain-containing protein n=1 Tax=Strigamia maritima TaxID=126957 RepID=T1J9L2_STRMM
METNNVVAINATSPLKRTGHIAVCDGRNILVWGGYREVSGQPDSRYLPSFQVWFYDSLLDVWSFFPTEGKIPPGTSGSAGALIEDNLYILGGYCEDDDWLMPRNTHAVFQLNLRTREWFDVKTKGVQPIACDKMSSWIYEEKIYLFGGFGLNPHQIGSVNSPVRDNFDFANDATDPISVRGWNNQLVVFDPSTSTWLWPKCKGPKPLPRAAHASVRIGNIVYTFGGRHQLSRMNDMHCLDLQTMTWSGSLNMADPIPEGRSWHSLNVLSETKLVLFGGFSQEKKALSDCWIFDTRFLSWHLIQMPGLEPRIWHTSCVSDYGELVVVGGCCSNILGHTETVYANRCLSLVFSPKSLFRFVALLISQHFPASWRVNTTYKASFQETIRGVDKCAFCMTNSVDVLNLGKFERKDEITVHYFCMLLSSGLSQNGKDDEGILGFLLNDIRSEIRRGQKLKCYYCRRNGATIGCSESRCQKKFHLPCAVAQKCLHQFTDAYPLVLRVFWWFGGDASWEMETDAFQDLLYRHNKCDLECVCPNGKEFNEEGSRWEIILCKSCGSQGCHVKCGNVNWIKRDWECKNCLDIQKPLETQPKPKETRTTSVKRQTLLETHFTPKKMKKDNLIRQFKTVESDSDSDIDIMTIDYNNSKQKTLPNTSRSSQPEVVCLSDTDDDTKCKKIIYDDTDDKLIFMYDEKTRVDDKNDVKRFSSNSTKGGDKPMRIFEPFESAAQIEENENGNFPMSTSSDDDDNRSEVHSEVDPGSYLNFGSDDEQNDAKNGNKENNDANRVKNQDRLSWLQKMDINNEEPDTEIWVPETDRRYEFYARTGVNGVRIVILTTELSSDEE